MILFIESSVTFLLYFYIIIIVRICDIRVVFVYFIEKGSSKERGFIRFEKLTEFQRYNKIVTAKVKYLLTLSK